MGRLLADGGNESSSNEIAPRLSRKRRKTGRFLYASHSICGVARGQTAQNEFHSKRFVAAVSVGWAKARSAVPTSASTKTASQPWARFALPTLRSLRSLGPK